MENMKYILRLITSFILCNVVSMALCWLATSLLALIMTILPVIISNVFSFSASDFANDVLKDQILPGWGFYSSIVNRPDFSARLTGFIATLILFAASAILAAVVVFIKKFIVKDSKSISIILGVTILCYSVYAIFFMFTSDKYNAVFGIDQSFWFYLVASIISILLLIICFIVTVYFYNSDEK